MPRPAAMVVTGKPQLWGDVRRRLRLGFPAPGEGIP